MVVTGGEPVGALLVAVVSAVAAVVFGWWEPAAFPFLGRFLPPPGPGLASLDVVFVWSRFPLGFLSFRFPPLFMWARTTGLVPVPTGCLILFERLGGELASGISVELRDCVRNDDDVFVGPEVMPLLMVLVFLV